MKTTSLGLKKPDGTDPVDIQNLNDNADIINSELIKRPVKTGAADEMTVTSVQASARNNLVSGETIKTSFGKIRKWFSDLKTVAFSGSYTDLLNKPALGGAASQAVANNLTTTAAGSVLDARQGKALDDKITEVNSNLIVTKQVVHNKEIKYGEWTNLFCVTVDKDTLVTFSVIATDTDSQMQKANGIFELQAYSSDGSINIINCAPTYTANLGILTRCVNSTGMLQKGKSITIRAMQATTAVSSCNIRVALFSNILFDKQ